MYLCFEPISVNERLKIVLLDYVSGAAALVLAVPLLGAFQPWVLPVVAVTLAGTGWIMYQSDRDGFGSQGQELTAYAALLGVVVLLGIVSVGLNLASLGSVARAALLGGGVALVGYRFVYGIVRPIPESRLVRAREGAW